MCTCQWHNIKSSARFIGNVSALYRIDKLIYSVWGSMRPTSRWSPFVWDLPPHHFPVHFRGPPYSPSVHKDETELAWVIGIIIISAFSASWVPEKVREQHEDRLISMLVLASIWQQTIGKGLGPGHSSMAQDSSHRQNTTTHWGSSDHGGSQNCNTGWPAEWLAAQQCTDNKWHWSDGRGKEAEKGCRNGGKKEKLTKIYAKKGVKIGISIKLHNTCCLEILVSSRTQAGLFCPEKKQWLS